MKPVTTDPDGAGLTDAEFAALKAKQDLLRDDSVVRDTFFGQLRSHIMCCRPKCSHVKVTFEPMMTVSAPLPALGRNVVVDVRRVGVATVKCVANIAKDGKVAALRAWVVAHLRSLRAAAAAESPAGGDGEAFGGDEEALEALDARVVICVLARERVQFVLQPTDAVPSMKAMSDRLSSKPTLVAFVLAPRAAAPAAPAERFVHVVLRTPTAVSTSLRAPPQMRYTTLSFLHRVPVDSVCSRVYSAVATPMAAYCNGVVGALGAADAAFTVQRRSSVPGERGERYERLSANDNAALFFGPAHSAGIVRITELVVDWSAAALKIEAERGTRASQPKSVRDRLLALAGRAGRKGSASGAGTGASSSSGPKGRSAPKALETTLAQCLEDYAGQERLSQVRCSFRLFASLFLFVLTFFFFSPLAAQLVVLPKVQGARPCSQNAQRVVAAEGAHRAPQALLRQRRRHRRGCEPEAGGVRAAAAQQAAPPCLLSSRRSRPFAVPSGERGAHQSAGALRLLRCDQSHGELGRGALHRARALVG